MGDPGNKGEVSNVVMVPVIISNDVAVHKDAVTTWNDFSLCIKVDWVRMAQNVLRYNVVIVGKFFGKGCWVSDAWRQAHPEENGEEVALRKELPRPRKEES